MDIKKIHNWRYKMAKFETKVCLVNKWDEVVCELEKDGYFYKFPMGFARNPLLDIGDEYKVVEIETEVE
jgi:hypothetical protein